MRERWMKTNLRKYCVFVLCLLLLLGIAMARPNNTYAAEKNGWVQEGEAWYYYVDGEGFNGWLQEGNNWYYLSGGYMYRDVHWISENNNYYFFNEKGQLQGADGGWIHDTHTETWGDGYSYTYDNWYYAKKGGGLLKGWQKIDGYWYYFDPSMAKGTRRVVEEGEDWEDAKTYFFNDKGQLQGAGGGWILDTRTEKYGDNSYTYENWYYANEDSSLVRGWKKIDGEWYYFGPEMYKGGTTRVQEEGEDWENAKSYYFNEKGQMQGAGGGWIKGKYDRWYYANKDGSLIKGWTKLGSNNWYYFDSYEGMYADGAYSIYDKNSESDKTYYFNKDGQMQAGGWIKHYNDYSLQTIWYFAGADGELVRGWKQIDGIWYYFKPEMAANTSIVDEDGKAYAFDKNGNMLGKDGGWVSTVPQRYWVDSSNKEHREDSEPPTWYFAKKGGELVTGWDKLGSSNWYYFNERGVMVTGSAYTEDGIYYFAEDGKLIGQNGGWTEKKYTYNYYNGEGKQVTENRSYWIYTEKGGKAIEDGWKTIDGVTYYFSNGQMARGECDVYDEESGGYKTYIFNKNGTLSKGGWVEGITSGGKTTWYYANSDGTPKKGWLKDNGKWYFFSPERAGGMSRGAVYDPDSDKTYVMNDDGTLSTGGWVDIKNSSSALTTRYYANADGTAVTGWQKIGGTWYYFDNYMFRGGRYSGDKDKSYVYDRETNKGEYHRFAPNGAWLGEV